MFIVVINDIIYIINKIASSYNFYLISYFYERLVLNMWIAYFGFNIIFIKLNMNLII